MPNRVVAKLRFEIKRALRRVLLYWRIVDLEDEIISLRQRVEYLSLENSSIRSRLRGLLAVSPSYDSTTKDTLESFDFQWGHIPHGDALLTDADFKGRVTSIISQYCALPPNWFQGKEVLDAGCGMGRFTFGLCQLGAKVHAFDRSPSGVAATKSACQPFHNLIECFEHDILQPVPGFKERFDLVFCFGVIHHTRDALLALSHLAQYVRPDGYLFIMVYGEPRFGEPGDFATLAGVYKLQQDVAGFTPAEKVSYFQKLTSAEKVHMYFDSVAPTIGDLFSFAELRAHLARAGFADIKRTVATRNHHIVARNIASQVGSTGLPTDRTNLQ